MYVYLCKIFQIFNDDVYKCVYPMGSRPARTYGLPKLHKMFDSVPALDQYYHQ